MIAYVMTVTRGCIHTPFMEVKVGTTLVGIKCDALREFIQIANEIGLYQALESEDPAVHELLIFVYEEFKDDL